MAKPFKFPGRVTVCLCSGLLCFFSLPSGFLAQNSSIAPRDPNAVALAGQALQALAGVTALRDITLEANATYIAGSDEEMGAATLVALGNQQSLVTLNLTNGQRVEVRSGTNGGWTGPDGTQYAMALHNCWVEADWFFPALTLQALQTDPTLGVAYLGAAEWNGAGVIHLQFFHIIPGQTAFMTAQIQGLSTWDLYLDPQSLLPLALDYNTHPGNNLAKNIPMEIQFAGYSAVGGVQVPSRIQRFEQGTLALDLAVSQAKVNSGVAPSTFTIATLPTGGAQ